MRKVKNIDISKYRGRNIIEERKVQKELNKIYKQTNLVNKLLKALKDNDMYDVSGAVENLITYAGSSKVNLINNKGYVSSSKIKRMKIRKVNLSSLTKFSKPLKDFLINKQSTPQGVKEVFDSHLQELIKITGDKKWASSLSFRQQKNIYKMFDTESYEKVNSQLASTEIFTPYVTAVYKQWTQEKFIDTILRNTDNLNDLELRNSLKELYNSTIKGKIQYARKNIK